MLNFLIHLLGGYTSDEYEQVKALENLTDSENKALTEDIEKANVKNASLLKQIDDLQNQLTALNKVKGPFIIHVDGKKVWIESEQDN